MHIRTRIISIIVILLSLHIEHVSAHNFQDVHDYDWFAPYIEDLAGGAIINTSATYYYPNRSITRAELAKMAVKSAQHQGILPITVVSTSISFCDIPTNNWAHEFVSILANVGVTGIQDTSCNTGKKFLPNQPVTRAEAMKILFLVYNINISGTSTFRDVPSNAWYSGYVAAAQRLSIVNGYQDGTFRPNGLLTRAEMAKIVSNLMSKSLQPSTTSTSTPSAYTNSPTSVPTTLTSADTSIPRGIRQIVITPTQGEDGLRDAVNNAIPGDEILLTTGTYHLGNQLWIDKRGTADHPIIIRARDGKHTAKITGSPDSDEGINIGGGASYIIIDGIEIYGMGNNVLHVQSADHITIQNIKAHDAGIDGDVLKVNQASHISILNNELARSGARPDCSDNCWQELLDFLDTDDSVISGNIMRDFGNLAGYIKGGSTNVLIENNTIEGQRAGAGDPAWGIGGWSSSDLFQGKQYEAINITFRNNVIRGSTWGALGIYDASNVTITNNQFLNNHGPLIEFRAGNAPQTKSENITITNNTFNDNTTQNTSVCQISSHDLSNLTLRSNTGNNAAILAATTCNDVR